MAQAYDLDKALGVDQSTGTPPATVNSGYDWDSHVAALSSPLDSAPPAPPVLQYTGIFREPLLAVKALGTGVSSLLTNPGDLLNWISDGQYEKNTQNPELVLGPLPRFPTSAELSPVTNALGLTGTPQLTPQTAPERFMTVGLEALPAAGMAIASGGGAAPSLAAAEAGAMTGEEVHELAPGSRWLPTVAGTIAGLGVGGLTGFFENRAAAAEADSRVRDANTEVANAQQQLKAAQESAFQGRYDNSTGLSKIRTASQVRLAATKDLGASLIDSAETARDQVFQQTATKLGTATTLQEAGEILQELARNWLGTVLPTKLAALSDPLNAVVPPTAEVPLNNFLGTLKSLTSSAGKLQAAADLLSPALPRKLLAAFTPDKDEAELNEVFGIKPLESEAPTWSEARALRTLLGDAKSNPGLIRDIGAQNIDALYSAVTKDLGATAEAHGAGDLWKNFNEGSTKLYNLASGPMSKIISTTNPSQEILNPEDVATRLLNSGKRGASTLADLRSEIPDGMNELAAAGLRNPKTWASLSPEAKAALVPDETTRNGLDSISSIRDAIVDKVRAGMDSATEEHRNLVAAASADAKAKSFQLSRAVRDAQAQRESATAQLDSAIQRQSELRSARAETPLQNLYHLGSRALGGALGYEFAPTLATHLGIESSLPTRLGLMAAGYAVPLAWNGVKTIVQNPQKLIYPGAAGLAASNALSLDPENPAQQPAK